MTARLFAPEVERAIEAADGQAERELRAMRSEAKTRAKDQAPLGFGPVVEPPAIADDYGEPT